MNKFTNQQLARLYIQAIVTKLRTSFTLWVTNSPTRIRRVRTEDYVGAVTASVILLSLRETYNLLQTKFVLVVIVGNPVMDGWKLLANRNTE